MNEVQNIKILIVDDDLDYGEILENFLKKNNFVKIEKAYNGVEAIEKIKQTKPDLTILDVMMPEKDGIDVALEIMSNPELKGTKFVFLTSFGEDLEVAGKYVDEQVAKQLGALKFFRKQQPLEELVHLIKDTFNLQ